MEKKITASIYFDRYNTFIIIIEYNAQYSKLVYINILDAIKLKDIKEKEIKENIIYIIDMILEYNKNISNITLILSNDYYDMMLFPGNIEQIDDNTRRLIMFEFNKYFLDNKKIDDFYINLVDCISIKRISKKMLYATLLPKQLVTELKNIFIQKGIKDIKVNYEWVSVINNFIYNYPENYNKNSCLVSVNDNFIEFILISNFRLVGYESLNRTDNTIAQLIEQKLKECLNSFHISKIHNLYLYGYGLYKNDLLECQKLIQKPDLEVRRFNPFRMLETNLDKRNIEYCSRVFQLFAASISNDFIYNKLKKYIKNVNLS